MTFEVENQGSRPSWNPMALEKSHCTNSKNKGKLIYTFIPAEGGAPGTWHPGGCRTGVERTQPSPGSADQLLCCLL